MAARQRSILLVGESNVGKTHYGAQTLKRLIVGRSSLKMYGQATNLSPYENAMESLAEGRATGHTPAEVYVESVWPVIDQEGRQADLIWPDYGGEQVKKLTAERHVPVEWRSRILSATDWVLLIRLHTLQANVDIFSRPLAQLGTSGNATAVQRPSDQARLIELLQMLLYVSTVSRESAVRMPTLTILLSCWDEVKAPGIPFDVFAAALPMLCDFVQSVWKEPATFGLSALGKALSDKHSDSDYSTQGPERFGFFVKPDGAQDQDITWPMARLLEVN